MTRTFDAASFLTSDTCYAPRSWTLYILQHIEDLSFLGFSISNVYCRFSAFFQRPSHTLRTSIICTAASVAMTIVSAACHLNMNSTSTLEVPFLAAFSYCMSVTCFNVVVREEICHMSAYSSASTESSTPELVLTRNFPEPFESRHHTTIG